METERGKRPSFLQRIQFKADEWIENTTYRLSPTARVLIVLILGGGLFVFSTFYILNSMYHLGKRSAERELFYQQETENQKLKQENNILNFENYEYN